MIIDITASLEPSRYGDPDQWVSTTMFSAVDRHRPGAVVELRMKCKYTRRTERFTVLYQGPGGAMRTEHAGLQVTGPLGSLICQAVVIAATPIVQPTIIDVEAGDVLVIHGQRMVIVDDKAHSYPYLRPEVEVGLFAALAVIREHLSRSYQGQAGTEEDNARRNERQAALTGVLRDVAALGDDLRTKYAVR